MLSRVRERKASYNNASSVTRSSFLSYAKVLYYRIFAWLYGLVGRCCNVAVVNSTWTHNHIVELWGKGAAIVYPPCNVTEFLNLSQLPDDAKKNISVVSIGQFRPEKDHTLQLYSFASLLFILPDNLKRKMQLDFVGSCRNTKDYKRVEDLKQLAEKLVISDHVKFHLNVSFPDLLKICQEGTIGIHTMWNEHFGIGKISRACRMIDTLSYSYRLTSQSIWCLAGVVEGMAAGLLTVAHDSGGPKADIVVKWNGGDTGLLAHDTETFASAMKSMIMMSADARQALRERARDSVQRFTDERFDISFYSRMASLLT